MAGKISQTQRVKTSVYPQDITTQRTGTYVDMSGAQRMLASIMAAALADTKTVTVQLMQAQDAGGTGAKVLGSPVTVTAPSGGGNVDSQIDVQIADLDSANNFGFVAVRLVSNNATALYGAAQLTLGGNRYNP